MSDPPTSSQPANERQPPKPETLQEALNEVSLDRIKNIGRVPCARDSLLYGVGGGAMVGAGRYIASSKVMSASNWAVGAFALISVVSWELCHYQRLIQARKLGLVVESLNKLEEKKRRTNAELREALASKESDT